MLSEQEVNQMIRQQRADEKTIAQINWSTGGEFPKDFGKECIEAAHNLLTDIIESNSRLEKLSDD
jgi:hypothetical protein